MHIIDLGRRFQGGGIMTLHEKIDYLLKKRNMNRKQLSKESGIPYTTIMNMYNRDPGNMNPGYFRIESLFFLRSGLYYSTWNRFL